MSSSYKRTYLPSYITTYLPTGSVFFDYTRTMMAGLNGAVKSEGVLVALITFVIIYVAIFRNQYTVGKFVGICLVFSWIISLLMLLRAVTLSGALVVCNNAVTSK